MFGIARACRRAWLQVTPQIIARIHSPSPLTRKSVHTLLNRVAKEHPQGLIYPLTVAAKSHSQPRQSAALRVLSEMRKQCDNLVEQAALVSMELIRTSILWHEMWHTALEEASRMYFGAQDVDGMLATLAADRSIALVLVTHRQDEIDQLGFERVLRLDGRERVK